jgi:hypothetical protein
VNRDHLILALADGASMAEKVGEYGLAAVLYAMVGSLTEAGEHENDPNWRVYDLRALRGSHKEVR